MDLVFYPGRPGYDSSLKIWAKSSGNGHVLNCYLGIVLACKRSVVWLAFKFAGSGLETQRKIKKTIFSLK